MTITVRNALERDIPALAELEEECIPNPWSVKTFESAFKLDGAVFLTAEDENGTICGFLTVSSVLDEFSLDNIAVKENYRGNGIAALLIAELEKHIEQKAAFITLEVRQGNLPAVSLYKKCGFKPVGIRKNYYSNPTESALLMTKYYR